MSVVTIQFGQCGNQIGYELYSMLSNDIHDNQNLSKFQSSYELECLDRWFSKKSDRLIPTARAVLVDTEQKVINDIYKKQLTNSTWRYHENSIVSQKDGGAGNNWAYGFNCKGPQLEEMVMDCVQKEMEQCDRLLTILNIFSSAGGTGSGVGSYIIECLRDEYPTKTFINATVFPYQSGEVVTQNYNTLLSLAKVYDVSDMHFIFQNDHLHKMSSTVLKLSSIGLKDLNALIALKMSSVLQPVDNYSSCHLPNIVSHLAPHPGFKFVSIKTAPHIPLESAKYESNFKWETLIMHVLQMLRICSLNEETMFDWEVKAPLLKPMPRHSRMQYVCSFANMLVTRGNKNMESIEVKEFSNPALYPRWIPPDSRFLHFHESNTFSNLDKFVALVTNNSLIHYPLNCIVEKAWKTFSHKAYLHQYNKYNINEEEFLEAFAKIESLIKMYKEMH